MIAEREHLKEPYHKQMTNHGKDSRFIPNRIRVFYAYSHEDEELRGQLEKHLTPLRRRGYITDWHDRKIGAGREWEGEIHERLNSAHVILLLISIDFINSDYCYDIEMKRALERHEAKEARVIPILLRPVDWQIEPFAKLQALPEDLKPVTRWEDQDEAFLYIAKEIRKVVDELKQTLSNNND